MKFLVFAVSALALAACSKPAAPPASAEKPVENPVVATETPTPAPASLPASTPGAPSPEFASLPAPYNAADFARGKRTFKLCASCHHVEAGAGNLVGPNLHSLFGRKAGSLEGFAYSKAVKEAGFEWTPEKLDEWLAGPSTFLPGNAMSFAGVRKPEDRQAVIAYLMVETAKTE
jgi:cytochrome c